MVGESDPHYRVGDLIRDVRDSGCTNVSKVPECGEFEDGDPFVDCERVRRRSVGAVFAI